MGSWKKQLGLNRKLKHTAVAVSYSFGHFDLVEEKNGLLSLPKGEVEYTDKSLRHAVSRELHEELGLVGKIAKKPFYIHNKNDRLYHCFRVSGVEKLGDGHLPHYQLSLTDLEIFFNNDLLVGRYIVDICKLYIKR